MTTEAVKSKRTRDILDRTNEAMGVVATYELSDGATVTKTKLPHGGVIVEIEDPTPFKPTKAPKEKSEPKNATSSGLTSKKLSAKIIEQCISDLSATIYTLTSDQKSAIKAQLLKEGYDVKYYSNQLSNIKINEDKKRV